MFMIHVPFFNIVLSLFTCFMPAYSKKVDMGMNYMYPRVLSLYETVIFICALLYDPNGVHVINLTQGQLYLYTTATVSLIGISIYPSTWP